MTMKKIFVTTVTALALLCAPQQAEAQGFFKKLKDKAQQAVSNVTNKMTSGSEEEEEADSEIEESKTSNSHDAEYSDNKTVLDVNKKATQLQREKNHVGSWNTDLVTPSATKFPVPLMNELPAIPSAAEIADPTESAQATYYQAIQKVALRAEMLSEDLTCNKEQQALFEKQNKEWMMKAFNLNEREYGIFAGEINASEAEQKKVINKVLGYDPENLMAAFEGLDNFSEEDSEKMKNEMLDNTNDAIMKVYKKYPTELKKYLNKTPAEMNSFMQKSIALAKAGKEKEAESLGQKMEAETKAFQKTLSPADQKAAAAFEKKLQGEVQPAMMEAFRKANPMGDIMSDIQEGQKKMAKFNALKQKRDDYYQAISNAIPDESFDNGKDYNFAAADRKKVEALRDKIFATNDPEVYNPLYVQANEIIKTYRLRAAKAWRAEVEKRFNTIKSSLPGIIKLNRQAIEDQIIPECMLYRVPLNMVLTACETLEDAYSSVPTEYPELYQSEEVRRINLNPDEWLWWPEFYVISSVAEVLEGKTIFKYTPNGGVFQFNAGKWVSAAGIEKNTKALNNQTKAPSQKWKSSDGKRTVTYVEEGGYFLLPEGDMITPCAIEQQGNNLIWADIVENRDENGQVVSLSIIKCTYKL